MTTHVGREYTIAVSNEEGWDNTKDFWRKASVDGREPVQCEADVSVDSVGHILDLINLGWIRFCCPGTELNARIDGIYVVVVLTQVALPVLT